MMLFQKIRHLKDNLSKVKDFVLFIERDYKNELSNLKSEIKELHRVNDIKNKKLDDLNKKVAFYELETKSVTNDISILANTMKDLYFTLETMLEFVSMPDEDDAVKKKIYH